MQCTPEEIEKKRIQALQRLAAKKKFTFNKTTTSVIQVQSPPKKLPTTKSTINLVLHTETTFVAQIIGFHSEIIQIYKTIPSRSYDSTSKLWSFSLKDYDLLQNKLEALKDHFIINKIPSFVLKCVRSPKNDLSLLDLSRIDSELLASLMPFQKEGVAFGVDKGGRCMIADEMGLGKTFQALGIASYYRQDWPLLIVTTASMKNTWEETILQYVPSAPAIKLQYMVTAKDYIDDSIVLIVSHDMLKRVCDKLLDRKFGVIIIDESHTFKNFKAKGTEAASKLTKKAKRVILLTGTPALSRPSELFTQLSFIDSRFFGNFFDYSARYCDGKTTNFGWDATGQSNLQELEIILARKFMIRRTKDRVLQSMPDKNRELIKLDVKLETFSESDRSCLNSLAARYERKTGQAKHAALITFFAETAKIKIPSVSSYVLQILENKADKFLLFAHHQIMLDAIEQILKQKNQKFVRIDGNTNTQQRKYLVDQFQNKNDYVCALLSITAANAGITLTAADLVIFAELHWNPSILNQAESRAHRIGQNRPVTIRYLIAHGTADDSIWTILERKRKTLQNVGLCEDNFENVEMTSQKCATTERLTDGITYKTRHSTMDITSYFESPSKKQKINDSIVEELNDSLFPSDFNVSAIEEQSEAKNSSTDMQELLNDGWDDIFLSIDI